MAEALTSPLQFADPLWHRLPAANTHITDSHRRLQREVRQYVTKNITPFCHQWESAGEIPQEVIRKHAEAGYHAAGTYPIQEKYCQGIRLPGDIKPSEWDALHNMILVDEIARCGYTGIIWGLNRGSTVNSASLRLFATEEQKEKWLRPLIRGEQAQSISITEPDAGSDVAAIEATAERTPDGKFFIVNGYKKWVTMGMYAENILTAVKAVGGTGITMLMISTKSKGLKRTKMYNTGCAASGSAYVEFDDVKVPVENILGKEGNGFKMIMSTFNHERVWIGITTLRLARVCYEDAFNHALNRETFEKSLLEYQSIRAKFTRMAGLIQSNSSLMEQIVIASKTAVTTSPWYGALAGLLKVQAGQVLEVCSRESQQVFGGLAYTRGGKAGRVEQIGRDVRVLVVSGGSEEILADMVAKQLLKQAKEGSKGSKL